MRSAQGLSLALLLAGFAAFADESESVTSSGMLLYNVSQRPLVTVVDGDLTVNAENSTAAPVWGHGLLRAFVENRGNRPERVELEFLQPGSSGTSVRRTIEARPGRMEVVNLVVPSGMTWGMLHVRVPGLGASGRAQIFFTRVNETLLAVGTDEGFQAVSGKAPDTSTYGLLVRSIPGGELPTELAAYTGYNEVVVLSRFEELPEGARRTLEAYASTGGTLVLTMPSRAPSQYLPLLPTKAETTGLFPYGFGQVRICDGAAGACAPTLVEDLQRSPPSVSAFAQGANEGGELLPQAVAPVGRFLLIILAFSVAIGPGSVWVARKKGPPMLLLTIPATAALTCLLIVGWSVLVDGFAVHGSMHGFTLLDRRNHRAISLGLGAFYANIAPGEVTLDADTALLPPNQPSYASQSASTDWTKGQVLGADFIPSRTYREWGVASVRASRARLAARPEGETLVVENALGSDVQQALLMHEGRTYVLKGLRDGQSARAVRQDLELEEMEKGDHWDRFDPRVRSRALAPLQDGEFIAWVEGPGPTPFGGLSVTHHNSQHVIRGEVER